MSLNNTIHILFAASVEMLPDFFCHSNLDSYNYNVVFLCKHRVLPLRKKFSLRKFSPCFFQFRRQRKFCKRRRVGKSASFFFLLRYTKRKNFISFVFRKIKEGREIRILFFSFFSSHVITTIEGNSNLVKNQGGQGNPHPFTLYQHSNISKICHLKNQGG